MNAQVFDGVHLETDRMNFGLALEAMQKGVRVARAGWNGKDQWLVVVGAGHANLKDEPDRTYAVRPYIALKTVQGDLTLGWVPSTGDLFANDWCIVSR